MKKKKRGNKSIILRIMILGVCAYMVFTFAGLWKTWNDSTKQLNELKAQYSAEKNDIEELKALLEDGSKTRDHRKGCARALGICLSGRADIYRHIGKLKFFEEDFWLLCS